MKERLVFREEPDPAIVSQVVETGYAPDLSDDELIKIGRDPFLISFAFSDPANRCVVTTEVSKPSRQRANRHVPDVCADLGVTCLNAIELINELDFRIP